MGAYLEIIVQCNNISVTTGHSLEDTDFVSDLRKLNKEIESKKVRWICETALTMCSLPSINFLLMTLQANFFWVSMWTASLTMA
jgi:hypothetical protein